MRRVKLSFAAGVEVEFMDRERGLPAGRRVGWEGHEVSGRRLRVRGCEKTSWLKQVSELLRGHGYEVICVDSLRKDFIPTHGRQGACRRSASCLMRAP